MTFFNSPIGIGITTHDQKFGFSFRYFRFSFVGDFVHFIVARHLIALGASESRLVRLVSLSDIMDQVYIREVLNSFSATVIVFVSQVSSCCEER